MREQAENVSLDSFLYHCADSLNAITTRKGIIPSHIQYPPFLNKTWEKPSDISIGVFLEELEAVLYHHSNISPYIKKNLPLDTDNLFGFCSSFSHLIGDIIILSKSYFGVTLPQFPAEKTAKYMGEEIPFQTLGKLLVKYNSYEEQVGVTYRPFSNDDYGKQEEETFALELWSLVLEVVDFHLPFHSELFATFVKYKFNDDINKIERPNWKDLPPVGFHYESAIKKIKREQEKQERMERRRNRDNKRGDRPYKKDFKDGGSEERGQKRPYDKNQDRDNKKYSDDDKRQQRPRRDRDSSQQRGGRRDNNYRDNPLSAQGSGNGPQRAPRRGDRGNRDGQSSGQVRLENALVELDNAIQTLGKNKDLSQVQLAPQNSYIRSQQHSVAKEKGFKTQSVGEDRQRAVCLLQKA